MIASPGVLVEVVEARSRLESAWREYLGHRRGFRRAWSAGESEERIDRRLKLWRAVRVRLDELVVVSGHSMQAWEEWVRCRLSR